MRVGLIETKTGDLIGYADCTCQNHKNGCAGLPAASGQEIVNDPPDPAKCKAMPWFEEFHRYVKADDPADNYWIEVRKA